MEKKETPGPLVGSQLGWGVHRALEELEEEAVLLTRPLLSIWMHMKHWIGEWPRRRRGKEKGGEHSLVAKGRV